MKTKTNIFWFRRDLRLEDNHGLFQALSSGLPVVPLFIFDRNILDELEDKNDPRVNFIYQALLNLQKKLEAFGSGLDVRYGHPEQVWKQLVKEYSVGSVFANHDYEPYARERDHSVAAILADQGIPFKTFRDQVIFERNQVVKENGEPYHIFTPYSKKWRSLLKQEDTRSFSIKKLSGAFHKRDPIPFPALEEMGFVAGGSFTDPAPDKEIILHYDRTRDIPSLAGTTRMGVHLRFGTVSIRQLVRTALSLNEVFLNELIWREFFMQMLWHYPRLVHEACKTDYERIAWRNNNGEYERWCRGETGYPLVDAGMRELNETGFMHNRVRMVTASFLVKHLLIDWRWGEAYFARKLMDYELSSNNGNWQWVAGCGCDAAPYFRIFNPTAQVKRFDPKLEYIRKWIPELDSFHYPKPMVHHEEARKRCLETYQRALRND